MFSPAPTSTAALSVSASPRPTHHRSLPEQVGLLCAGPHPYRAVDMSVFQDLAGEAVGLCTDALKRASMTISASQSPDDGDLFLIKVSRHIKVDI